MTSPLERTARALFKMFRSVPPVGDAWRDYIDDARTILTVIREPSDEMISIGGDYFDTAIPIEVEGLWQAMIDTALSEGG